MDDCGCFSIRYDKDSGLFAKIIFLFVFILMYVSILESSPKHFPDYMNYTNLHYKR